MDTLELDRPPGPRAPGRVDLREAAAVTSAAEVMRRGQVSVTADATLTAVHALLKEKGAHAAPVVDAEGKLVGVVTEGDIERFKRGRTPAISPRSRPEPS